VNTISPKLKARALECLLAAGVVGAGWYFLLRPAEKALAEQREELRRVRAQVEDAAGLTESVPRIEQDAKAAEDTLKLLHSAEGVATVSSRLYDSVNRLASSNGVKVIRLDPTGLRPVSAAPRAGAAAEPLRAEVQEYRISVQGKYQSVANFVHACEHSLGTSAVTRFRVSPIPDSTKGDVEATVETAHLRVLPREGAHK
jgi:Tfp pilus assembly protein PilO